MEGHLHIFTAIQTHSACRLHQNACWVVGVAKAGSEDDCDLMAGTCIVNPDGEIVALAETASDELIVHHPGIMARGPESEGFARP